MSGAPHAGDVAIVTDKFGRTGRGICNTRGGWDFTPEGGRGSAYSRSNEITDLRPLIVIDPEDEAESEAIIQAFVASGVWRVIPIGVEDTHAYRRQQVQAALLSLIAPPKPDEPTDPKARVTDRRENIWRLLADGDWVCTSGPDCGEYLEWRSLTGRGPLTVEGVTT